MAANEDRDRRDAAGVGPYARERDRLVPMSSLDNWKVTEGEPDIRGWEIRTVSGRQLGSVSDLLVDRAAGEVVMIDADLPATDRHVYVPIRVAHIDRATRVVLMDSADFDIGRVEEPSDRGEVVVERQPVIEGRQAVDPSAERRRAERRTIDRVSTDL